MRVSHNSVAVAALLTAALAVAGCSSEPAASPPEPGGDGTEPAVEETDAPEGPHGTIELSGHQQSHPNSTTVAVNAVTVDEAGDIFVDIEALVAGTHSSRLASASTVLIDDLGNSYEFVPPEANPHLDLAQDTQAQITLAFAGPVDPQATRVSLGLNGSYDGTLRTVEDTFANSIAPTFAFEDLPLPGVGLDAEAAGPDDPVGLQVTQADIDVTGAVHEGATQVRIEVTNIEVSPSLVTVTVEAVNNSDRNVRLIQRPPELRAELDGQSLGQTYPFEFEWLRTDEGEFDVLSLDPGAEATARFAFRGVVPAHATGLRLGLQVLRAELDQGKPSSPENEFGDPVAVFTGLPLPEGFADSGDDAPDGDASGDGTSETDPTTDDED